VLHTATRLLHGTSYASRPTQPNGTFNILVEVPTVKGSGERKEGRRKEKRNKVNLVLLLVDETSLFL
jgi:hypothetical protein